MPRKTKHMELTDKIRMRLKENGLRFYEVADELEVAENTLRRWLRCGCDEDHYTRVMSAIDAMVSGGGPR